MHSRNLEDERKNRVVPYPWGLNEGKDVAGLEMCEREVGRLIGSSDMGV